MEQLSPRDTTAETCVPRAHVLQQEMPLQGEAWALQLESSPRPPQRSPSAAESKEMKFIKKQNN